MAYRDTASFGKRQEYTAIAALLRRGFDVYMTLVDDQGIDCIVRLDEHRYVDIQIKARSLTAKQPSFFAAMSFKPRDNLFFIFYTEKSDQIWVMPSNHVSELSYRNLNGKNKGKQSVRLPSTSINSRVTRFDCYRGDQGFDLPRKFRVSRPKPQSSHSR
jgi:hypothetical protein